MAAGKPFKVTTEAALGRNADGRFTKLIPSTPMQVIDRSGTNGVPLPDEVRASQVPDRDVRVGVAPVNVAGPGAGAPAPVYPEALPWPEAGPNNDANKLPFKVK